MKFSSKTIESANGLKSLKEIAAENNRNFFTSVHENELRISSATKRTEESIVWNNELCMPTYATDETIIHCRVRREDDVSFNVVPKILTDGLNL